MTNAVDLGRNRFARPGDAGRADEVCMVFRRTDGEVLTFRKTFYPPGVYRLLTGGINPGEGIVEALRREAREETGLAADPHRLLAVVGYRVDGAGPHPSCHTFAFLVNAGPESPEAADPHEQVEDFRWMKAAELRHLAVDLERLGDHHSPDLDSSWGDWGRFRAVIHRVVWDGLRAR